MTFKQ